MAKDDAFGSVSATVFGRNLHTFGSNGDSPGLSISEVINAKLGSIGNFKAQFVKISMRRHVLMCLENSPSAIKFTKPVSLAINYISLMGLDLSNKTNYLNLIM